MLSTTVVHRGKDALSPLSPGDADPGRHGDSSGLSLQDLISFSHQVAEAMAFLSSNNVGPSPCLLPLAS